MTKKILAAGLSLAAISGLQAQQKPNVVFILADDLGYGDLGCFGQKKVRHAAYRPLSAQRNALHAQHTSDAL